ncbi:hypothetical protein [Pedobacter sp. Leaf250]|uniref:hypothetical protein n=1 Tax=Pedobacter sp. Leaf250 TaxID=2876559 RepID=UPI001E44530F|nr:hypothetical protein [Pedobacter sp. Leaf250]
MKTKILFFLATLSFYSFDSFSQGLNGKSPLQPEASHINNYVPRYEMLDFFQYERNYLPYTYIKADQIKGKATVADNWAKGDIVMKNDDIVYANVDLNYNQVEDKLFVKANKGIVILKNPVQEFTINDGNTISYFRTGFPSINTYDDKTIYEVLKDGEFKLLKRVEKMVFVTVGYNLVTEKRYDAKVKYFVNDGNIMYEIMPNMQSVQNAANRHGLPVDSLLNGYAIKNESQLVSLIKKLP